MSGDCGCDAGSGFTSSSPVSAATGSLSKAGRFASGWSLGPEGEDSSSSGRLAEAVANADGEADMIGQCQKVLQIFVLEKLVLKLELNIISCIFGLCTPGVSKKNLLVLVLILGAMMKLAGWIGGGALLVKDRRGFGMSEVGVSGGSGTGAEDSGDRKAKVRIQGGTQVETGLV